MVQQTISGLLQETKEDWLDAARAEADKQLRYKTSITIEDVLNKCPLPGYLHRNTIGSVFNSRMYRPIGYTKSRRTVSRGRVIQVWGRKEVRFFQGGDEYADLD
jgi:hypothetical protein